ncbi:trypsin-like peptidase domain-containing protein [Streptomyces sp. NPDC008159]|uniref:trypsin-like peptidase domain-containing protein n=1 Tax=Streptomyces sp. NPDC008159 TaxID=3364817 RepID=UPI0036E13691
MTGNLEKILRDCTVLITDRHGKAVGSGFFVTESLVLTAAHVINDAAGSAQVNWNGNTLRSITTEWMDPPEPTEFGVWPLPDLALLRVHDAVEGHPAVLLGERAPGSALLAEGYTRGTSSGYAPDSARLEFETIRPEGGISVIKCKDSIIDDGLSGGPVLDLKSGEVVGVVKGQRTGQVPIGGIAISVSILRERYSELWMANVRFHHTDRRWEFARLNSSEVTDPAKATRGYLQLIKRVIAMRPAILPPGAHMADIHQLPSIRPLPQGADARPEAQQDVAFDELELGDVRVNTVFQWKPLGVSWRSIVLHGMPGAGKSWLLSNHADAIADDALNNLKEGQTDPLSLSVPIVVDCAVLGNALPDIITRDSVLKALISTIKNKAEDDSPALSIDAVARLAYEDGRLVSCLDALDEVSLADRQKVRQALPILAERGNQLLITSRPSRALRLDTAALTGCFTAEVVGFSPGQVLSFARAWFLRDPTRKGNVETELIKRTELRELARVPLLAAFLCQLASEGDHVQVLPSTRVEVYKAVLLGALSGHWHDPTQQALDQDNPPDPLLRLRILASAVGQLSRSWRSGIDRYSRTDLATALRTHPDHDRAATEAQTRRFAWQALRPQASGQPPQLVDPLIWEYMFDGIMAHDLSESSRLAVRFAHPVLGEFCVAEYVASLSEHDLRRVVEEHRWFDSPWQEVWAMAASLMKEPDTLVDLLVNSPTDSWFEQTFLASRCVASAGIKVRPEMRSRVVSRVISAARSWRSFDRERALAHLGALIQARVGEAISAGHSLLNDSDTLQSTRLRTAASLAETGDQIGLEIARQSLNRRDIPAAYRAWCARAVLIVEDFEGIAALQKDIKGARKVNELRTLISAIPVESKAGGDLAAQVLGDQEVHMQIRSLLGSALIRSGNHHRVQAAKDVANTTLTVWNLRAALISELLAVGEEDMLELGLGLFDDPNLSADRRVTLLESLIQRGETSVLPRALEMLARGDIGWEHRRRLARALVELGPSGIEELRTQVDSALAIELKMRHIIALVEVGECLDVATQVVVDPGTPAWIRARVATGLLDRGYLSLPEDVLMNLAIDPDPGHEFQDELIISMTHRNISSARKAAQDLLLRARKADHFYSGSANFIANLATAGTTGKEIVGQIAQDERFAEEDRALAIISMADIAPREAAELALTLHDKFSTFTESRLIILLATKGVIEVADLLSPLVKREPAAYRALFQLLSGPRTSVKIIQPFLPIGEQATKSPPPENVPPISPDAEFLREVGLTWSSEAELQAIMHWVEGTIRKKVNAKLFTFLTVSQLEELERLEDAEQQFEFLASRTGGYSELVQDQTKVMRDEIRANPSIVPQFKPAESMVPMDRLSYVSATLSEWVTVTLSNGPQASSQFLRDNAPVFVTEEGLGLINLACQMTKAWNPYEGHQFLMMIALRDGLAATCQLMEDPDAMHNLLRDYLNEGSGADLLYAALAGLLMEPESEVVFFYGALGAAIIDHKALSLSLMHKSGQRASESQRQDGLATLRDEAERFEWPAEFVEELNGALADGTGESC